MKLLLCVKCDDVIKLAVGEWRQCECGAARGQYLEDGDNVEVSPGCVVLGINNTSLSDATRRRNDRSLSASFPAVEFAAFVFPDNYRKIRRQVTEICTAAFQELRGIDGGCGLCGDWLDRLKGESGVEEDGEDDDAHYLPFRNCRSNSPT
jgi:hypothetical protein